MSKLKIDLLRHGESQFSHTLRGHLDDDLTPKGWQQMQSTIEQDTNQTWNVIVSSSLKRCACFAEQLAKTTELPLLLNHDLKEMFFGDWEGISTQQIYETSPEFFGKFLAKTDSILSASRRNINAVSNESPERFSRFTCRYAKAELATRIGCYPWGRN